MAADPEDNFEEPSARVEDASKQLRFHSLSLRKDAQQLIALSNDLMQRLTETADRSRRLVASLSAGNT